MDQKQLVQKWLEKLRDPETKQCKGRLGEPSGARCCLGVACDVFIELGGTLKVETTSTGNMFFDEYDGSMPPVVQRAFGIRDDFGAFRDPQNIANSLATMNDSVYSFKEIADVIESKPNCLFE